MNSISCSRRFLWLSYDILMPAFASWQTLTNKIYFFYISPLTVFKYSVPWSVLELTFLSAFLMFAAMRHHFFWVNISKANLLFLVLLGALFCYHCYKVHCPFQACNFLFPSPSPNSICQYPHTLKIFFVTP